MSDAPLRITAVARTPRPMRHRAVYYDRMREQHTEQFKRDWPTPYTPEEAVLQLPDLPLMEEALALKMEVLAQIERERDRLAFLADMLHDIDLIVDGVPIRTYNDDPGEWSSSWHGWTYDGNRRGARIYLNAQNRTTWGLNINEYLPRGGDRFHGGQFHGSDWPTRDMARDAALRWVAHGVAPKREVNYR